VAPVVRDDPAVETPSLQLQLGPRVAQFGVTTDFASMHGQEDVPTLPFVQEAEGLASKKPSQTSRSVWSKLFVFSVAYNFGDFTDPAFNIGCVKYLAINFGNFGDLAINFGDFEDLASSFGSA
jgi:hypothetical protein